MSLTLRIFEISFALLLFVFLTPALLVIALVILSTDGRPVFFLSERMRTPDRSFQLIKFRTMTLDDKDSGVSGGDKTARITRTGNILRRYRLDELPQIVNILRGDMSFVGPRPPLRRYTDMFPDLYADILSIRPGVTGLATLVFHRHEEKLLATCRSAEETEAVYVRRCIPIKARLDEIYIRNRTPCWFLWLMLATVIRRMPVRPTGNR